MKFQSLLISSITLVSSLVSAASSDKSFIPTAEKPFNFKIEYSIAEKQDSITDIVKLTNGDQFSLNYTFLNGEDEDVSVIGVGGSFNDPRSGDVKNNITAATLGPVHIASGETANFIQNVQVDVNPDDYMVVPAIYAVYNGSMIQLGSRSQLVSVDDAAISFFNPQLLFLELILLATIGVIGYYAYQIFGKQYLRSNQPIKVATVKRAVPADRSSSPVVVASGADNTWLPKTHLKTKKAKK